MKNYYVANTQAGGLIVQAKSREDAWRQCNFGGKAGNQVCRLAKDVDRFWTHGQIPPGETAEQVAKRLYYVPDGKLIPEALRNGKLAPHIKKK